MRYIKGDAPMSASIQALVPAEWRGAFEVLSAPVAWIPDWHAAMINYAWYGEGPEVLIKRAVILLPTLVLLTAVWSTGVSLYTLPFRSGRHRFLSALVSAWWDAGRSTWFFWAGIVRVAVLSVGWVWGMLRLIGRTLATGIRRTMRTPLVCWIAFISMLLWSAIEALILAFSFLPTLNRVFFDITGFAPDPNLATPLLWVFLWFLVLGSFAGLHALTQAIHAKQVPSIVQMSLVQLFVLAFAVVFLYRGVVEAVMPLAASGVGQQIGGTAILALAACGWIGVRGMTWFLFGRYGAPSLISFMAREAPAEDGADSTKKAGAGAWQAPIAAFKAETKWFKAESQLAFELVSLPVLQLFAAAVNFAMVPLASRPMFSLPFKSIDDALHATPRLFTSRDEVRTRLRSEPQLQGGNR